MARRLQLTLLAILAIALLAPVAATAAVPLPKSIAATGDSLTRAFGTGFLPFLDNPAASWSTGTSTTVNSHYSRLLARTSAIRGRNYNDARSGAKMGELSTQMDKVITQAAEYVTVELGGNDVCTPDEASMTPVDVYESQFRAGLTKVTGALPNVRVFVATVPNVYLLWDIFHNSSSARSAWAAFNTCQSMLANPTSTATADVERRARVLQRVRDYNAALERACASFSQCRFDANAAFNPTYTTNDVSHFDYFHPSVSGQQKFSAGTWAVSYWGP
jgi:lysophospholipase L1-like esterase